MKKPTLRELILENECRAPALRLSDAQLADRAGVKVASVHETKSRLRAQGRLAPSARQVTGAAALPLPDMPGNGASPAALVKALTHGAVLSADERLRLASYMAKTAPSPVAIQALRVLADTDPYVGRGVGPPVPQTDQERISRLASLMACCGREVSLRALAAARRAWRGEGEISEDGPPPRLPRED